MTDSRTSHTQEESNATIRPAQPQPRVSLDATTEADQTHPRQRLHNPSIIEKGSRHGLDATPVEPLR